ncbi:hypothetical protein [Falsiphaeobacter marinintestinus]|uniref:hypothetical protein n=1 Tax=Falsiphaeobacter marinintestinus TaxID=1492905 RepID=UPI0011B57B25|nr:hypothetical protein [Phaeobacter marinintestinus]
MPRMLGCRSAQLGMVFAFLTTLFLASGSRADVLPFSGAEVADNIAVFHVEPDGVRLELEVFPPDIEVFTDALAADFGADGEAFTRQGVDAESLGFAGLTVIRQDGSELLGRIVRVERRHRVDRASPFAGQTDPITGTKIPSPPDDPEVIFLEVLFDFVQVRPDALVLGSTMADDTQRPDIGFMVFDRSVPVSRFSFLNTQAGFVMDWADPWGTAFTNANLNRQTRNGTTSYVYATPREIRHEILMRVPDLAPWIGEQIETGTHLNSASQSRIQKAALDEFSVRNPVTIAGKPVRPAAVRGAFLTLDERGFQVEEGTRTLLVDTAFVGAILSYPVVALPPNATLSWDMFDNRIGEVPVTLTDPAGPFLDWATPDRATVTWTNYLKQYADPQVIAVPIHGIRFVPAVSVGLLLVGVAALGALAIPTNRRHWRGVLSCAAVAFIASVTLRNMFLLPVVSPFGEQSGAQLAQDALSDLLANTYVAALEVTPAARAATLAPLVSDRALDELAAALETDLAIRVPGGGLAEVSAIDDVSVEGTRLSLGGAYEGLAKWKVQAQAGHWGHDHRRTVEYRARVTLIPEGGHWKLAALTVLEARAPDV